MWEVRGNGGGGGGGEEGVKAWEWWGRQKYGWDKVGLHGSQTPRSGYSGSIPMRSAFHAAWWRWRNSGSPLWPLLAQVHEGARNRSLVCDTYLGIWIVRVHILHNAGVSPLSHVRALPWRKTRNVAKTSLQCGVRHAFRLQKEAQSPSSSSQFAFRCHSPSPSHPPCIFHLPIVYRLSHRADTDEIRRQYR